MAIVTVAATGITPVVEEEEAMLEALSVNVMAVALASVPG